MTMINLFDADRQVMNSSQLDCESYYAARYKKDWQKNVTNLVFTKTGVDNYIEQNPEYTKDQVLAEIKTNPMFARCFIKDPVQQSCYQHYAADYIRQIPNVIECVELPAAGPSALYVYDGKLCYKKDLPAQNTKEVKSIDFKIVYKTNSGRLITIWASHKHTRKDGGNQSNQWYDLIHFASHASKSIEDDTIYIALADGPYYTHTTDEGITKMEHINKYKNDHFAAMTTTDLINFLAAQY